MSLIVYSKESINKEERATLSNVIVKQVSHSAYDMFSKYKYLIANLVFPSRFFGVGISF